MINQQKMDPKVLRKLKRIKMLTRTLVMFNILLLCIAVFIKCYFISGENKTVLLSGLILGIFVLPVFLVCFKRLVYVNNNELEFIGTNSGRLIGIFMMIIGMVGELYEGNVFTSANLFMVVSISVFMFVNFKFFKMELAQLIKKELSVK